MKFLTGLVFSAILALVLMAGAVFGLGYVCSAQGLFSPSTRPVPIRFEDVQELRQELRFERAVFQRVQFVEPAPNGKAGPTANDWRRNFLCEVRASDIAIAGFGLFLVLAIVFNGLYQAAWMRRLLLANERSADVVNESIVATQRPYVFLREFRVNLVKNPLNEDIQACTIQPIWENSGNTPTRNGRSHINWKFFERSIPAEFDFPDFDEVGNRVLAYDSFKPLVVGPRSTSLAPLLDIEPSILRQARDGQGRMLIWGWAEYDEGFGDAKRHRTEFCHQIVVAGSPASWIGFTQHRGYNGVDDDCTRKPTTLARLF